MSIEAKKAKLNFYKQKLAVYQEQTELNNRLNSKTRLLLLNSSNSCSSFSNISKSKSNSIFLKNSKSYYSCTSSNLVKYCRLRETYMQHANYWQQLWLFTDNPIYEYEKCEGFENPNYFENLVKKSDTSTTITQNIQDSNKILESIKMVDSNLSCTNIYESILDFKTSSDAISSPDSGIHSDDRLNRENSTDHFSSMPKESNSAVDSLYSSIISSKKSSDNLTDNVDLDSDDQSINHVEQHELPLGWIRCCDEAGVYYWHKPSGTVTRRPPEVPKKNFNIDDYDLRPNTIKEENTKLLTNSTTSDLDMDDVCSSKKPIKSTTCSSYSSSSSSVSTSSTLDDKQKTKLTESQTHNDFTQKPAQSFQRFYVRSLGWVKISEQDLTPERSSKAVNKCINDLSRGVKDFNDVVARWGDGKDLYLDLEDNNLILIDPIDDKMLNKQSITSIRVWGVGRDNGRDFAYVARDKHSKIHMCHVFRSDSGPAKEIANALRDTCRRIIQEKKLASSNSMNHLIEAQMISEDSSSENKLKRPNYLPDLSANKKIDINLRLKSVSFSNDDRINLPSTTSFPTPQEEPKKIIKCKYLGGLQVNRPSGIEVLNDAIEKIYSTAYEEYKRKKREKRLRKLKKKLKENDYNEEFINLKLNDQDENDDDDYDVDEDEEGDEENAVSFDNMLDLNSERKLGIDVNVSISPSTVTVRKCFDKEPSCVSFDFSNEDNLILECRIRYLCFMGISTDVRLCGFIMHNVDSTFKCHAFLCENSAGVLCKTIEAACKLRYQKCLDAHPEATMLTRSLTQETNSKNARVGSFFSSQLRNMFDSLKNRNIFSNLNTAQANSASKS